MRIQYVGTSTVRLFDRCTFDRSAPTTLVQEVGDAEMIAQMLTQPGVDFVVADDDPLALLVGVDRAAELAVMEGITTPDGYRDRYGMAPKGKKIFREEVGYQTEET